MSRFLTYSPDGQPQVAQTRERSDWAMLSGFAVLMERVLRPLACARRTGPTPTDRSRQAADLADALRTVTILRKRVDMSDVRIKELEGRLTTFEVDTLELRSRLVCLHGKLATTAATARYQTLTMDLERRQTDGVRGT